MVVLYSSISDFASRILIINTEGECKKNLIARVSFFFFALWFGLSLSVYYSRQACNRSLRERDVPVKPAVHVVNAPGTLKSLASSPRLGCHFFFFFFFK